MSWAISFSATDRADALAQVEAARLRIAAGQESTPESVLDYITLCIEGIEAKAPGQPFVVNAYGHVCNGSASYDRCSATITVQPR